MYPLVLAMALGAVPPDAPVVWRFPGAPAEALREAVRAAAPPGHLVDDAALGAWLSAPRPLPDDLGCLADTATCPDAERLALATAGLLARVDATVTQAPEGFTVHLVWTPSDAAAPERTFDGAGETLPAAVQAAISALRGHGALRVLVDPPEATLTLDGAPLGPAPGPFQLPAGTHRLRAEAPDLSPTELAVLVPADGEVTAEIRLGHPASAPASAASQPGGEPFGERLKRPDPTVLAHPFFVRADFRAARVGAGTMGSEVDGVRVKSTDAAVELGGLGLSAGWRGELLYLDGLGLSFMTGGDRVKAHLSGGRRGLVDNLQRTTLRAAWIGVHWPAWRFDPYLTAGPAWAFESFDLYQGVDDTATPRKSVDQNFFLLGLELGLRYHLTPEWMLGLGGQVETFVDQRATLAFVLGAAYALDLPVPW